MFPFARDLTDQIYVMKILELRIQFVVLCWNFWARALLRLAFKCTETKKRLQFDSSIMNFHPNY